jgi:hypothetical protein
MREVPNLYGPKPLIYVFWLRLLETCVKTTSRLDNFTSTLLAIAYLYLFIVCRTIDQNIHLAEYEARTETQVDDSYSLVIP